ncbi:MAG: carboxypeptidase-like regulatory domain-containing protein [Bryobacteraceae bacterium]|jgi:carboxypeptidase family protein
MRLLLVLLAIVPGALAQCALAGRVIDRASRAPIPKVRIYAATGLAPAILTRTDENGAFCFEKLDSGAYSLIAQRSGYRDVAYASSRSMSGSIDVAQGATLDAFIIEMTARPILAGRVVDAGGDPVVGAKVRAVYASGAATMGRDPGNITLTDVHGRFRFYDLDPSTYHLIASPPVASSLFSGTYLGSNGEPLLSRQIETYYPAALQDAEAAAIELKAGSEVTGITITMLTTTVRHVSGRVIGTFRGYMMLDVKLSDGGSEGSAIQVDKDGTFRRDGLRPAKYTLRLPGGGVRVVDLTNGDVEDLIVEVGKPER